MNIFSMKSIIFLHIYIENSNLCMYVEVNMIQPELNFKVTFCFSVLMYSVYKQDIKKYIILPLCWLLPFRGIMKHATGLFHYRIVNFIFEL